MHTKRTVIVIAVLVAVLFIGCPATVERWFSVAVPADRYLIKTVHGLTTAYVIGHSVSPSGEPRVVTVIGNWAFQYPPEVQKETEFKSLVASMPRSMKVRLWSSFVNQTAENVTVSPNAFVLMFILCCAVGLILFFAAIKLKWRVMTNDR